MTGDKDETGAITEIDDADVAIATDEESTPLGRIPLVKVPASRVDKRGATPPPTPAPLMSSGGMAAASADGGFLSRRRRARRGPSAGIAVVVPEIPVDEISSVNTTLSGVAARAGSQSTPLLAPPQRDPAAQSARARSRQGSALKPETAAKRQKKEWFFILGVALAILVVSGLAILLFRR